VRLDGYPLLVGFIDVDRLAVEHPDRFVRMDANRPATAVSQDVMRVVEQRLQAADIAHAVTVA